MRAQPHMRAPPHTLHPPFHTCAGTHGDSDLGEIQPLGSAHTPRERAPRRTASSHTAEDSVSGVQDSAQDGLGEIVHARRQSKAGSGNPVWDSVDEGPYRAAAAASEKGGAAAEDAHAAAAAAAEKAGRARGAGGVAPPPAGDEAERLPLPESEAAAAAAKGLGPSGHEPAAAVDAGGKARPDEPAAVDVGGKARPYEPAAMKDVIGAAGKDAGYGGRGWAAAPSGEQLAADAAATAAARAGALAREGARAGALVREGAEEGEGVVAPEEGRNALEALLEVCRHGRTPQEVAASLAELEARALLVRCCFVLLCLFCLWNVVSECACPRKSRPALPS